MDLEKMVEELNKENDLLRAMVANGKGDCIYCRLPAEKIAECIHGFLGCSRADDMMLCPHVGVGLQAGERIRQLEKEVRVLNKALASMGK